MARVLLIGTVETKRLQLDALERSLARKGLTAHRVDTSLAAGGAILSGPDKLARIEARGAEAAAEAAVHCAGCQMAIAMGGGTGGEIALAALRALPFEMPKLFVTTLAFDPRAALADCPIILVPTPCDIEGMNATLARVFEAAAAMAAGLADIAPLRTADRMSIAVSTLGVTAPAVSGITRALAEHDLDATVFHANGFGGAAFTRFVREGQAAGVIDLNVHELGRMRLAGAHVPMPDRFKIAGSLPRIVLPGGLNFLGLGEAATLDPAHRARAHYAHSGFFTHVKLTEAEMADQARALAEALNAGSAPTHVLVPMGGFSHEDRPGGAIEDLRLREIAADALERAARAFTVERLAHHINTDQTARAAVDALLQRMPDA